MDSRESLQQTLAKAKRLEEKLGKTWREYFQDVSSPEDLSQRCEKLGVVLTSQEAQQGFSLLQDPSETELSEEQLSQLAGGIMARK